MKIVVSGYGKMGHMIEDVLRNQGIEPVACTNDVAMTPAEVAKQSVCIDFTQPQAFKANYKFIADNFAAAVVGTTGWNDIQEEVIKYFRQAGTTLVYASNFSIGVNVLFKAVEQVAKLLGEANGYDSYITEMHHIHKLDSPSGTAKTLAQIVETQLGKKPDVQGVRCGEICGIHTVGFEGSADRLTLRHEAFSRRGFAEGAVLAAKKAMGLSGIFEFKNII